jgi:pilus assembly protein CpaF
MNGETPDGKIIGRHRSTGVSRPAFWERARYYGEHDRLAAAMERASADDERPDLGFGSDNLDAAL